MIYMEPQEKNENGTFSVLAEINQVNKNLESVLFNLIEQKSLEDTIVGISKRLIHAVKHDRDFSLATIMINKTGRYTIRHAIDTAILATIVAESMGKKEEEIISMVAACLTMNIGMIEVHDSYQTAEILTPEQRKIIFDHPEESASLLKSLGVKDTTWINYVLDHHACDADSFNANNKPRNKISENTKIIFIADRYCALVSGRTYRKPYVPNSAIHYILTKGKNTIDPSLAVCFIKELGVYPPGTTVRLENGDIAVVSFKGVKKACPVVHSIVNKRGKTYDVPEKRDTEQDLFKIREVISDPSLIAKIRIDCIWEAEADKTAAEV